MSELRGTTVPFTSLQTAVARNMLESLKVDTQLKLWSCTIPQEFCYLFCDRPCSLMHMGIAWYVGWQGLALLTPACVPIKMSQWCRQF